jgi:hypothetical protein
MNKPIETVIAGLGRAGWDIHWRQLLKDHPAFRMAGVIEPMAVSNKRKSMNQNRHVL